MKQASEFLKDSFRGRRVLVTGHTGFKGSWLALWLKELGANVAGYALDPKTERDNFVMTSVGASIDDIRGDIRDFERLKEVFGTFSPEFVFHLAARPLVLEGYQDPKETYDVNVGGTVNVLENCRRSESVRTIINITSDKVYENREWTWGYRECDPVGGFDPYSSSKGCSEIITAAYRNSFFNPASYSSHRKSISTVRAGNVIGGGDWSQYRIVPDCIRSLERGQTIPIRSPKAIRPWQFVLEPLGGYLLLAAKMAEEPIPYSSAWNFGPEADSTVTVRKIVDLVIREWGAGNWEFTGNPNNDQHEANFLSLDISKARHSLRWSPRLNIEESVRKTVSWYRTCAGFGDVSRLSREQIRDYMEKMSDQ